MQWNALKLLNEVGEFISGADGEELLAIAEAEDFDFVDVKKLGSYAQDDTWIKKHIDMILALPLVDKEAIKERNFKVIVDAVNSTGGIAVPMLLEALGVTQITKLHQWIAISLHLLLWLSRIIKKPLRIRRGDQWNKYQQKKCGFSHRLLN